MGFRKAIYDVEEKGLDPKKPHKEIGDDGRLLSKVVPSQPAAVNSSLSKSQEEKSTQEPSLAIAATDRKEKEVETPKGEKVSVNIEFTDELPQATKEISDDKPNPKPKKVISKTRTRAKTNTSSPKKKTEKKKEEV